MARKPLANAETEMSASDHLRFPEPYSRAIFLGELRSRTRRIHFEYQHVVEVPTACGTVLRDVDNLGVKSERLH